MEVNTNELAREILQAVKDAENDLEAVEQIEALLNQYL